MFPGTKRPSPCRVSTRGHSGVPAQHAQSTKLCALLNSPEKPLVGGTSTQLHTQPTEPGPCLLSLNNARSIPRDKSLDNRWLFMTTRLSKIGASDKSLANLPVTQLLALVPERKAAKWERLFNHEQKATSALRVQAVTLAPGGMSILWKLLNQTLWGSGNRVKCAGRWEGLEAETDPRTIPAAGKGSFLLVADSSCYVSPEFLLSPFPFWIDGLFPFAFSTQASDYKSH